MKLKTLLLAAALAAASLTSATAATFRFAFQGDLKSLDSYSLNETFTLGVLGNVYEGLTKRDKNLEIVPVSRMDEVLARALVRKPEAIEWDEEKAKPTETSVTTEPPVEEESSILTAH